ncbi:UNVERIFIED_CONTAM: Astacin-like metalloprotease toxin 1 [Trichonephila clavipes]
MNTADLIEMTIWRSSGTISNLLCPPFFTKKKPNNNKYVPRVMAKRAEQNFLKLKPWENNLLGEEFDYNSIMLYGEYAFAKNKKSMTMKPRKEGVVIGLINDKPGLSESDVRRINKLYECNGK